MLEIETTNEVNSFLGSAKDATDPAVWGGKLVGLGKLARAGFKVPWTVGIPVGGEKLGAEYWTQQIMQYFPSEFRHHPYPLAFRSGARVSMPGMMDSVLNVEPKPDAIKAAIQKVWDSYWSDRARAYRQAMKIPDEGTAVVAQKMILPREGQVQYSGVGMTGDLHDPIKGREFNPIVEWVEGLGDKLVGGEAAPQKFTLQDVDLNTHKDWRCVVIDILRSIHYTFGPSDVEWTILTNANSTSYWNLFPSLILLQHRPIVYPPAQIKLPSSLGGKLGRQIYVGAPIGAHVTVTATVGKTLVVMEEFRPEHYNKMLEAKALVCRVGGETCHAAVVGRARGIAAVSGVPVGVFEGLEGQRLVVDGKTGVVAEFVPDEREDEEEETEEEKKRNRARRVVKVPDSEMVLEFWKTSKKQLQLSWLIVDFYTAFKEGGKRQQKVAKKTADVVAGYLALACMVEARHYKRRGPLKHKVATAMGLEGGIKNNWLLDCALREAVLNGLRLPSDPKQWKVILEGLWRLYLRKGWKGGYGGKAWALIAERVYQWATGEMESSLFCDAVFNIRHNTNRAFDKMQRVLKDDAYWVDQLLNARQVGWEEMSKVVEQMKKFPIDTRKMESYLAAATAGEWFEED